MVRPEPERPPIVDENTGLTFAYTSTTYTVLIADDEYRALMHYDCGALEHSLDLGSSASQMEITPAGIVIQIAADQDDSYARAVIASAIKRHITRCLGLREKWGT